MLVAALLGCSVLPAAPGGHTAAGGDTTIQWTIHDNPAPYATSTDGVTRTCSVTATIDWPEQGQIVVSFYNSLPNGGPPARIAVALNGSGIDQTVTVSLGTVFNDPAGIGVTATVELDSQDGVRQTIWPAPPNRLGPFNC